MGPNQQAQGTRFEEEDSEKIPTETTFARHPSNPPRVGSPVEEAASESVSSNQTRYRPRGHRRSRSHASERALDEPTSSGSGGRHRSTSFLRGQLPSAFTSELLFGQSGTGGHHHSRSSRREASDTDSDEDRTPTGSPTRRLSVTSSASSVGTHGAPTFPTALREFLTARHAERLPELLFFVPVPPDPNNPTDDSGSVNFRLAPPTPRRDPYRDLLGLVSGPRSGQPGARQPSTSQSSTQQRAPQPSTPQPATQQPATQQPTTQMAAPSSSSQPPAPGMSPSSSPRLPSPPPFTEVQIGPKSPTIGEGPGDKDKLFGGPNRPDDGASRRIRPGTKAADMASGPPLVPLDKLDSPFQLQEHLKALYHHHTAQISSTTLTPVTREVVVHLAEPPEGVERSLWLYELCRFLVQKCNDILVAFFRENPPCSAQTCPEMRASEWQYLCAVHDPPKSCCAIDYCCHTLDWAGNTLTSTKLFPSRLTLGSEAAGGSQASMRHLTNIFRRVYRIFAHAWFQHRAVFWEVEGKEGLYIFFKTVCDAYQLIPEDNYTIPAEAEGEFNMETPIEPRQGDDSCRPILKHQNGETEDSSSVPLHFNTPAVEEGDATMTVSTGATTRRHKHTPSTGSFVNTIAESTEEEEPAGAASGTKEGEKEEVTPIEGKPKVDEKADEGTVKENVGAGGEEVAKGVASLDIDETKGVGGNIPGSDTGDVPDTSAARVGEVTEFGDEKKAGEADTADNATEESLPEAKTAEESGAEKAEPVSSGEV